MFEPKRIAAAALGCMILSSNLVSARVTEGSVRAGAYGMPAYTSQFNRQVVISPETRSIHVTEGEVIEFVLRDKSGNTTSFTWNFDTWGGRFVDLRQLAPDLLQRSVQVFIEYDARYRGQ